MLTDGADGSEEATIVESCHYLSRPFVVSSGGEIHSIRGGSDSMATETEDEEDIMTMVNVQEEGGEDDELEEQLTDEQVNDRVKDEDYMDTLSDRHLTPGVLEESGESSSSTLDTGSMPPSVDFYVNRASVSRSGLIPCCVFVGRVRWNNTQWEIYFAQKQVLRLHFYLHLQYFLNNWRWLRGVPLPWTIWREKRAERRVADVQVMQSYVRTLLDNPETRMSEPLLEFLEVSPSRLMHHYGPSLKEGYVHLRINGAFQLPLHNCINRVIESVYRHVYHTWIRILFVSSIVIFMVPCFLLICAILVQIFHGAHEPTVYNVNGTEISIGDASPSGRIIFFLFLILLLIYFIVFVYMFFHRRLGVIRRWAVLKPNCIACYRRRSDKEPTEVFLFDRKFVAAKGSYRQGIAWMPSGFLVRSNAGFIEIDTGNHYLRFIQLIATCLVTYAVMRLSWAYHDFKPVRFPRGIQYRDIPASSNYSTMTRGDSYCGYVFEIPEAVYFRVDDPAVYVSYVTLNRDYRGSGDFKYWGSPVLKLDFNLITAKMNKHQLIGVTKRIDRLRDTFVPSNYSDTVKDIGTFRFNGVSSSNTSAYMEVPYFCNIPLKVAQPSWEMIWFIVGMLVIGAFIVSAGSLLINFIMMRLGILHSHVRRDHWYSCIKRLQKAKHRDQEYRYRSFAPQRTFPNRNRGSHASTASGSDVCPSHERPSIAANDSFGRDSGDLAADQSGVQEGRRRNDITEWVAPNVVSWLVDGEDAYDAIYKAILSAKHQILIAGWWVCPDLFLKRPQRQLESYKDNDNNETQLKKLLLRKAEAGVKVYVLIYREVKVALGMNSSYTKRSLSIHPNIRVLRDPIFQIQSLGFWSHHEKIVVIDQVLGFVGGLDICFGRYDYPEHPICDPGGNSLKGQVYPGIDYSNPIIKDFVRVHQPFNDLIDRHSVPRMPWHDVHSCISGPAAQDLAYHFIQRWNYVCAKNDYELRTGWCICCRTRRFRYLPKCILPMDFSGCTLRYPSDSVVESTVSSSSHGSDDEMGVDPFEEPFAVVTRSQRRMSSQNQPHLRPSDGGNRSLEDIRSTEGVDATDQVGSPATEEKPHVEADVGDGSIAVQVEDAEDNYSVVHVEHPNSKTCNVQIVRSVSMWSAGVPTEQSIHEAYRDVIANARHYLYIENQFFISGTDSSRMIGNRILQSLVDRIARAIKEQAHFRVYVVMPLLPALEGNVRSQRLTNLHAVMHWQFSTICRGKESLFAELRKLTDTPEDYVAFFGLRNYGIMPNGCVSTEQIYIHSKLMIADDRVVIIGSANINDRSMMGDRDSEIAMVMEDTQLVDGWMDDMHYQRGVLAGSLRMQLFREHLGLKYDDASTLDPASEYTWQKIRSVAQRNTKVYESVFDCAPSNRMRGFADFADISITQIYENQRLNPLKGPRHGHLWDAKNLKEGDYAPWTDVNGVPIAMDQINLDDFVLDIRKDRRKRQLFSMDQEGWCYARNFSIFQQIRTGKTDVRKRDLIQHFMTDRLMAQVRRRRWVRKDAMPLTAHTPTRTTLDQHGGSVLMGGSGSFYDSETDEGGGGGNGGGGFGIFKWRRSSRNFGSVSDAKEASFRVSRIQSADYSPMSSNFHHGESFRTSHEHLTNSQLSNDFNQHLQQQQQPQPNEQPPLSSSQQPSSQFPPPSLPLERHRSESTNSMVAKLKRWYSTPIEFNMRASTLQAEYFDNNSNLHHNSGSTRDSFVSPHMEFCRLDTMVDDEGSRQGLADEVDHDGASSTRMGQVQTAATVPKEVESRARDQLSEIRGHLVEFPLDFLVEEILKPSIVPRDIHI